VVSRFRNRKVPGDAHLVPLATALVSAFAVFLPGGLGPGARPAAPEGPSGRPRSAERVDGGR